MRKISAVKRETIASCRSLFLAYNTPCRMRYGQAHIAVGQVEDYQALVWH